MDPFAPRPRSPVPGPLLTAGGGRRAAGGHGRDIAAGTGARTPIAEDLDRRRDNRRHAIAMKRTHPRQPAG
jgi:hypothetical protein